MIPKYDPLLDDLKDDSITEDTVAPTSKGNGYYSVVADVLYYFTGNHRYKIAATLDDPVTGTAKLQFLLGGFLPITK
jgi:hypothetical protein